MSGYREGTKWPPTCDLCGVEGIDVVSALIKWADPVISGGPYSSGWRCKDQVECRQRVELAGQRWPVDETRSPIEFTGADPA